MANIIHNVRHQQQEVQHIRDHLKFVMTADENQPK